MLKELADQKGTVNLFTRPRRFGKTLTLSMVRTFFEDERNYEGGKIDNRRYFDGKKIMEAGEKYTDELGQYQLCEDRNFRVPALPEALLVQHLQ